MGVPLGHATDGHLRPNAKAVSTANGKSGPQLAAEAARRKIARTRSGRRSAVSVTAGRTAIALAVLALVAFAVVPVELHHKRMGHFNTPALINDLKSGAVTGINLSGVRKNKANGHVCPDCLMGKMKRASFKRHDESTGSKAKPKTAKRKTDTTLLYTRVGDLVHMDGITSPVPDEDDNVGALVFKDEATKASWVYPYKRRVEVYDHLPALASYIRNVLHGKLRIIRTDNAPEFVSVEFKEMCRKLDIEVQYSSAYTPEQNSEAERNNGVLQDMARTMLNAANLPQSYWSWAMLHACYLRRRIGHERLGGMTPFFVLFGYKPDLSTMRVFGCKAWGLIPKAQRTKWDARAVQGVYVGESRVRSARLIYEEKSGKLLDTPHAICDEQQFGAAKHPDWQNEPNPAPPSTTTQSALGPPSDLNGADVGVGRSVEVPLPPLATTGGVYTTERSGETPLSIARKFGVDVGVIIEHNDWSEHGIKLMKKSRLDKGTGVNIPKSPSAIPEGTDVKLPPTTSPAHQGDLPPPPTDDEIDSALGGKADEGDVIEPPPDMPMPPAHPELDRPEARAGPPPRTEAQALEEADRQRRNERKREREVTEQPTPVVTGSTRSGRTIRAVPLLNVGAVGVRFLSPTAPRSGKLHVNDPRSGELHVNDPPEVGTHVNPPSKLQHNCERVFAYVCAAAAWAGWCDAYQTHIRCVLAGIDVKGKTAFDVLNAEPPRSIDEALSRPDSAHWKEALDCEKRNLLKYCVYDVVPQPQKANLVSTKMVFKVKKNKEGGIAKYKCRCTARGFSQRYGVDYFDTMAPVISATANRCFFAQAAQDRCFCRSCDIPAAYLQGTAEERILLTPPPGWEEPRDANGQRQCWALRTNIYGTKQAGHVWGKDIREKYLIGTLKFAPCGAEPCLLRKEVWVNPAREFDGKGQDTAEGAAQAMGLKGLDSAVSAHPRTGWTKTYIAVTLYVDDVCQMSPSNLALTWLEQQLYSKYETQMMGKTDWYYSCTMPISA